MKAPASGRGHALLATVLAALGLAGCASAPRTASTAPWPAQRVALQHLRDFAFSAHLAAVAAGEGFSAALEWRQSGEQSQAELRSPLGTGALHLQFDGQHLSVRNAAAEPLSGAAAEAELAARLGAVPPLRSLPFWLRGVPDPASGAEEQVGPDGQLEGLIQQGWRVEYGEYARVGVWWLPTRLTLTHEALRLKLHVRQWRL